MRNTRPVGPQELRRAQKVMFGHNDMSTWAKMLFWNQLAREVCQKSKEKGRRSHKIWTFFGWGDRLWNAHWIGKEDPELPSIRRNLKVLSKEDL